MKKAKFEYESWAAKHGLNPNATKREKILWYEKEREFWHEGRFGLVGPHYFALTQGMVKTASGKRIRPFWRDADEDLYGSYVKAKDMGWDLMVLKRRELGLTLTFGGIIPLWIALTNPGSTSLLTSADKTRLEEMYKEKMRVAFDGLDKDFRPGVVSTRQWGYLHMGRMGSDGTVEGLDSKIVARETVDNPQAFEAYRAMHVFIDEFFLHPYADKVLRSAQASVKSGFTKLAPIVLGGSAGESSIAGQKKGSALWRDAEILKLITVFVPGWKGISSAPKLDDKGNEIPGEFLNFCPNGHSDEQAATEWILRTREKLDKAEDKSALEVFIKQYPLEIQEVFSANAKGNLPKHVLDRIQTQERIVLGSQPPIEKVDLFVDMEGVIQKRPNKKSDIQILQVPEDGHTYIAGIDPIPFVSKNMGDGSKQAIVIKDLDLNRYVAIYAERDSDPDQIISNMINLQKYYNNAPAMLEVNRGGVVLDRYKVEGCMHLLARKPMSLFKGHAKRDNSHGYYKNDHTTERGNYYLMDYLYNYAEELLFLDIIDEAKNYLVDNTDFIDAMIACEILHRNIIEKTKSQEAKYTPKVKEIPVLKYVDGRYIRVWQKVNI